MTVCRRFVSLFVSVAFCVSPLVQVCMAAEPSVGAQAAALKPIEIGSRWEPFVDDYLVEKLKGARLQMHSPRPAEVVFNFDAPWEGSSSAYVTIFRDGPLYRMYYRAVAGKSAPASGEGWVMNTCYAESRDGIHWERPNVGLFEFEGSKKNNIVWPGGGPGAWDSPVSNFAAFKDPNPNAPPSERYKALGGTFGFKHPGFLLGYVGFVSPDGINWRQLDGYLIDKRHWPEHSDDASLPVYWSEHERQYVAYLRIRVDEKMKPMDSWNPKSIRWFGRTTSKDFRHWTKVEMLDYGDAPIEHFYTVAIVPYFRAPHLSVGFPLRFLPGRDAKLPATFDAGRGKGMSDTVFISSRDGVRFDRRFMESLIRPGLDLYNWTDRNNMAATGIVQTGEDEMSLYLSEHNRLPTNRLRRRVIRLDGIVSVRAPFQGGELVTKPLVFDGERLAVNYSTSAAGGLRVEILDSDLRPVSGHSLDDAVELIGDSVEQTVEWKGGATVGHLAGKVVSLRFVLNDADLFAFRFGG